MGLVNQDNGDISVDKKGAFCEVLSSGIPTGRSLLDNVEHIGDVVQNNYNEVSQQALNNCYGDWYEWLLAIKAWNKRATSDDDIYAALQLPNKSSYEVSDLYVNRLSSLVPDLRQKARRAADVELITSNPDFAIIDVSSFNNLPDWFNDPIQQIEEEDIENIKTAYELFDGECELDDLRGYIGAKKSTRPDRILQFSHEGSLMKAIYTHLQTREWIMDPQGIKYYAVVGGNLTAKKRETLSTVATHSITTVDKLPEAAVDEAFVADTHQEVDHALNVMLT